jgi:hypothetical protein
MPTQEAADKRYLSGPRLCRGDDSAAAEKPLALVFRSAAELAESVGHCEVGC